jgi:uncharacterized membrane protein
MPWAALPLSVITTVIVPASISWLFARSLYRPSLKHPFVYLLGAGFLGGALVVLALALFLFLAVSAAGQEQWRLTMLENWPLLPLLMFSEAFIDGMCISALAIFRPAWLKTFDDQFYLS